MRLNPDCIRDILLTAEEHTGYGKFMDYNLESEYERLKQYCHEEVMYHIKQCELSGLLTKVTYFLGGNCLIHDISPAGHEFLANIRQDNNWNKTKEIAKSVGSYSLSALSKIASEVIAKIINSKLGL